MADASRRVSGIGSAWNVHLHGAVIARSGAPAAQVPLGAVGLDYFACEYPKVFGSLAFEPFQPSLQPGANPARCRAGLSTDAKVNGETLIKQTGPGPGNGASRC